MNRLLWATIIAAVLASLAPAKGALAGEGCELVADISVDAVKAGALEACRKGRNPLVCAVAAAVIAADDKLESGTKQGCDYVVTTYIKDDTALKRIKIKSEKYLDAIRDAYDELSEVDEIRWIKRRFGD